MTDQVTGASERHEDRGAVGSPVQRPVRPASEAGRLTNAELADAIEQAWQMQHRTGRMSANHGDITAHLAALLKEQRRRAESA